MEVNHKDHQWRAYGTPTISLQIIHESSRLKWSTMIFDTWAVLTERMDDNLLSSSIPTYVGMKWVSEKMENQLEWQDENATRSHLGVSHYILVFQQFLDHVNTAEQTSLKWRITITQTQKVKKVTFQSFWTFLWNVWTISRATKALNLINSHTRKREDFTEKHVTKRYFRNPSSVTVQLKGPILFSSNVLREIKQSRRASWP